MSDNPMQSAHDAPRCAAKSKRIGQPCRSPAVGGFRVCRMHGAGGGAPEGKLKGNFRQVVARMRRWRPCVTCESCCASRADQIDTCDSGAHPWTCGIKRGGSFEFGAHGLLVSRN
jgi:hypothetical protein